MRACVCVDRADDNAVGDLLTTVTNVCWDRGRQNAAKARGKKIRELFACFGLAPEADAVAEQQGDNESARPSLPLPPPARVFFRTITSLPLPVSGRYEVMPPEVVAAALGKVIHLLLCVAKYLKLTYAHPMVFNGSFSTIGNTSEGAGCHTLYPDGSLGFDRGVAMVHENIACLWNSQGCSDGTSDSRLHPTDILGNLLAVGRSPQLGTLCESPPEDSEKLRYGRRLTPLEQLGRDGEGVEALTASCAVVWAVGTRTTSLASRRYLWRTRSRWTRASRSCRTTRDVRARTKIQAATWRAWEEAPVHSFARVS